MINISLKFLIIIAAFFSLIGCFSKDNSPVISIEPTCIAAQSVCHVDTGLGRFFISFDQEKPTAETPFNLVLDYRGEHKLKQVSAYMEGVDMFMGKIPLLFIEKQLKNEPASVFNAQVLFGSCSAEQMTWKIIFTVDVENNQSVTQQSFFIEFTSFR